HGFTIEGGNGFGSELNRVFLATRGSQLQAMIEEVEVHLKGAATIGDRRGRQASRVDVERGIPPGILSRRKLEADFAYDLGPQLQRTVGIFPLRKGQGGPFLKRTHHTSDYALGNRFLSCRGSSN